MAKELVHPEPAVSFEYQLFEGDPDHMRTVVASSSHISPWINPESLKLRHRIGRGDFGDVWLATRHQFAKDYDEYHEVAVKMLYPVKEDHIRMVLEKFEKFFLKCQGVGAVCWLQGISILHGKICIIMKFYGGSVGDKMARLKEGRISLRDVLRYGIQLAEGILELHSIGILVLNIKPCNVLLSDNDQAILGDFGVPSLLHGFPLPSPDMAHRLGTPNYMAPEQWQPEVRGPISFETDSWGFGCTIVEMLTGVQPWSGKSVNDIYHLVVRKHEKTHLPIGLPSAIENVLRGCFEYDLRNRPLMADILHVFKSYFSAVATDGGWRYLGSATISEKSSNTGYTEWFLSKDHLQVGDVVRSRKPPNTCKPQNMNVPEGTVVGLERNPDHGFVLVRVLGIHDPLRIHVSTLERVTFGLAVGDWIRLKEEGTKHSPVGILHSIGRDGSVSVGFVGLETLWKGISSEFQMAKSHCLGQFVRLKANVLSPQFEWPRKRGGAWATGKISWILPNGCLIVKFPGLLTFGDESSTFLADPAEVEVVDFNTYAGVLGKYQHLEDFHWAVRPALVALGLFTAMKLGIFVKKKIWNDKKFGTIEVDGQHADGQNSGNAKHKSPLGVKNSGNPAWVPPTVKNILFR